MNKEVLQVAFNKAYLGVLAQGGMSDSSSGCAYRGHRNRKCGVGHIIPDSHYYPWMDDQSHDTAIEDLLSGIYPDETAKVKEALIAGGIPDPYECLPFLKDLQYAHDTARRNFPFSFVATMQIVAHTYGLELPTTESTK
jgi:hypothetical protein